MTSPAPHCGELFATNQVSPETERCYKYQLRNFTQWIADSHGIEDMEDVTPADLLACRQSIQHLAASSQNRYLAAIKLFFAPATFGTAGIVIRFVLRSVNMVMSFCVFMIYLLFNLS